MKFFLLLMGLMLVGCTSKVHEMKKSPCALHEKLHENRLKFA